CWCRWCAGERPPARACCAVHPHACPGPCPLCSLPLLANSCSNEWSSSPFLWISYSTIAPRRQKLQFFLLIFDRVEGITPFRRLSMIEIVEPAPVALSKTE